MAIYKQKGLETGVIVNYWRITRINENFDGSVEVYLGGYLNKQGRLDGKTPIEYKTFQFSERDLSRATAYELLTESKKEVRVITPAVEEVKDEEGNIITEAVAEVTEEVEMNEFANAGKI